METALTDAMMLRATLVAGAAALAGWGLLRRRVRPPYPLRLGGWLLALGPAYFALLYGWAAWTFWSACYAPVLPAWARWAAPGYGALTGTLGWAMWWLAKRVRRAPLLAFLVLGGLHSLPGHLYAIRARGLLARCPMLSGLSEPVVLLFGFFEFWIYWALLLAVAWIGSRGASPASESSA